MKTRFLTFILLLSAVLVSCNRTDSRLAAADSIMESAPETAMEQLEQINPKELSEDDYAYYALLYTQAQTKCHIVVDSDSLISAAYKKYAVQRSGNLKMRTLFYNATIALNKNDFKSSMKDAVAAYDIAKESEDSYWIAKTSELLSDIFYMVYNYRQAEVYEHEAVENYLLAGRIDNHRYALCDLASTYLNENRLDDAKILVDSLYEVITNEIPIDSALLDYLSMPQSSVLLRTAKLDELEELLEKTSDADFGKDDDVSVSIMKSIISYNSDESVQASTLLTDAYQMSEDEKMRVRAMYGMYRQDLSDGKYKEAAVMADSLIRIQSDIAEELLRESVTGAQSDFYTQKAEYQKSKAKWRLYVLVVVILVAFIIVALLVIIYRLKIRTNKAELEASLASLLRIKGEIEEIGFENKRLTSELVEKSQTIENLKKRADNIHGEDKPLVIEHLFREKWSTLNMLCTEYLKLDDTEQSKSVVLNNIAAELKKLKEKKNLKEIEHAVDRYMGGIMSMLREECAFLTEKDFQFLSLVYAGFSAKSTCLLTDNNPSFFYVKKNRISKRIATSNAPHLELFIRKLR